MTLCMKEGERACFRVPLTCSRSEACASREGDSRLMERTRSLSTVRLLAPFCFSAWASASFAGASNAIRSSCVHQKVSPAVLTLHSLAHVETTADMDWLLRALLAL